MRQQHLADGESSEETGSHVNAVVASIDLKARREVLPPSSSWGCAVRSCAVSDRERFHRQRTGAYGSILTGASPLCL